MTKKYLYTASALIALAPISFAALAQDNPAARQTPAGTTLNEITVLSQRREESAQKVPISVTALPEKFLIENDVHTLEDLNGTVPGFVTTNSVNYGAAPLSIRGIGGANGGGNFFADEPVAVYVDGIYISGLTFSTADLLDIENIEVLRGPQGTLYGRNSTAGALLIRSARPTDEFEGYVRASGSSLNEWRIGHELRPLDIVVVNTKAGAAYGSDDYVNTGCGMGYEATMYLLTRGVRLTGTDAWSWDAPFSYTAEKYKETGDASLIWEGHKAGRDIGYCHLEKLHNLEALPSDGFVVSCFPVKIKGASAGWTRAVAILDD